MTTHIRRNYPTKDVAEKAIEQAKRFGWTIPTVTQKADGWDVTFTREVDPFRSEAAAEKRSGWPKALFWIGAGIGVPICLAIACLAGAASLPRSPMMLATVAPAAAEVLASVTPTPAIPTAMAPTAIPPTPAPTEIPPTPAPSPTEDPRVNHGFITAGTWLVASEVEAGTYRGEAGGPTFGPGDVSDICYWARLSGLGGTLGEIIANKAIVIKGPYFVEIAPSDLAIETTCTLWAVE
jgi:hypothetical protein